MILGPLPDSPTPGMPWLPASSTWMARAPWSAATVPLGGETMLSLTTGGRLPMLGQLTVEVILM